MHQSEFSDPALFELYKASLPLNGQAVVERQGRNTTVTQQAIQEFVNGIGDDNPKWLEEGASLAPPSFFTSVRYPVLHGKQHPSTLANLVASVSLDVFQLPRVGDEISAVSHQTDVTATKFGESFDAVNVLSRTEFMIQPEVLAAQVQTRLVWRTVDQGRPPASADAAEKEQTYIQKLQDSILSWKRRGDKPFQPEEIKLGAKIEPMVLPPLTIADVVAWEAAIGLPYRAGRLKYLDCINNPISSVNVPSHQWPYYRAEAHIDPFVAQTRGLPAAFDNAIMRLARLSVMLTDWAGDQGELMHVDLQLHRPLMYGDVSIQSATISGIRNETDTVILNLDLSIKNQFGLLLSTGHAVLRVANAR